MIGTFITLAAVQFLAGSKPRQTQIYQFPSIFHTRIRQVVGLELQENKLRRCTTPTLCNLESNLRLTRIINGQCILKEALHELPVCITRERISHEPHVARDFKRSEIIVTVLA